MIRRELKNRYDLFSLQPYRLFALSGLFATFGNGIIYVTTAWFAYQQHPSISSLALLMFFVWMPSIVLGPLFGVLADRYNRRLLIVISNVTRGIAVLLYTLLLFLDYNPSVYYLAAVLGLLLPLYMPAAIPLVQEIVPEDKLIDANATVDMIYEVGAILGISLSGFFILYFKEGGTLLLGGLFFLLSGTLSQIMDYKSNLSAKTDSKLLSFIADYSESIKYLRHNRHLVNIYTVQMLIMILFMTIPILLIPYVREVFNAEVQEFALFEALFSVGIIIGGLITPIFWKKFKTKITLAMLTATLMLGLFFFSQNTSLFLGYTLYAVISFGLSSWAIAVGQAQLTTDSAFQGRLQATFYSISGIGVLLIYVILIYYDDIISIQSMYLIESALAFITLLLVLKSKTEAQPVSSSAN